MSIHLTPIKGRISSELIALFGRKIFPAMVLIVGTLNIIIQIVLYQIVKANTENFPPEASLTITKSLSWPYGLGNGLGILLPQALGGILVITIASLFVGQEYSWGAISNTISRGVSRTMWLLGKAIVLTIALFVTVGAVLLLQGIFSIVFTTASGISISTIEYPWGDFISNIFMMVYVLLPYASFALLLAVITRSAALSIGIGIGYTLFVENLMSAVIQSVSPAAKFPQFLLKSLSSMLINPLPYQAQAQTTISGMPTNAAPSTVLTEWQAALLILTYIAIFFSGAFYILQKQDL
ncbi:MAG: ABC transporter permease subunit [Chloroflexota bacterium]